MLLAAVVALVSALCFAVSSVAQHHVASAAPTAGTMNPRLFLDLMRSPLWWAGSFGDLFGFSLQAVALAFGAVAVVQPILVTGLLLAIPVSAAVDHRHIARAEIVGALLCCAGLAAFLLAAQPNVGHQRLAGRDGFLLLGVVGPIVAILLVATIPTRGTARSVALAVCAGTIFGVCSPLLSAIVRNLHHPFGWPLLTVAGCGIAGFLLTQNAYQAGSLPAALACVTITEPIVAVTLGVTLLHERLDASGIAIVVIVVSVAAVISGVALVARNSPNVRRQSPAAVSASASA